LLESNLFNIFPSRSAKPGGCVSAEVSRIPEQPRNVPLADLMRLLEIEGYSSTVVVRNEQQEGRIKFSIGVPISAVCGPKSAEEAVYEMLTWQNPKIALSPVYTGNEIPITTPLQKLFHHHKNQIDQQIDQQIGNQPTPNLQAILENEAQPTKTVPNAPKGVKPSPTKANSIQAGKHSSIIAPQPAPAPATPQGATMNNVNEILAQCMQIDGAVGVALADYSSGMALGMIGGGGLNLEVAAAGNTDVVRSKLRVMKELGLKDSIDDILITLGTQYHLIRLLPKAPNLFVYIALDRTKANLAMARHKLVSITDSIAL
jgi:Domain of unknown function (DUF4388)